MEDVARKRSTNGAAVVTERSGLGRLLAKAGISIWAVATSLALLPYAGPYGWRVAFLVDSLLQYPDQALSGYLWRASWGMSGDMVYGSVEGAYEGFTPVALLRLAALALAVSLGLRLRLSSSLLAFATAAGYAWAVRTTFLSFGADASFGACLALAFLASAFVRGPCPEPAPANQSK